jgi:hypothetical protein
VGIFVVGFGEGILVDGMFVGRSKVGLFVGV